MITRFWEWCLQVFSPRDHSISFGRTSQFRFVEDAVGFVSEYEQSIPTSDFVRYELNIRYSNGDEVRGTFREKLGAIEFLRSFEK